MTITRKVAPFFFLLPLLLASCSQIITTTVTQTINTTSTIYTTSTTYTTSAVAQPSSNTSAASLSSIKIEGPTSFKLGVGFAVRFDVTGVYSDGSTMNINSGVTWNSSYPSVASISSGGTAGGTAKGITVGTTKITASRGGVTSQEVTITVYIETRSPVTP